MFRFAVLVAVFIAAVSAGWSGPTQHEVLAPVASCGQIADFELSDYSASYTQNFTGDTRLCHRSFITGCRNYRGVQGCNDYNEVCIDVSNSLEWSNSIMNPNYASRVTEQPEVCVSRGVFMHPEAGVSVIAFVIFAFIMLSVGFAFLVANAVEGSTTLLKVAYGISFVSGGILLFSYYFLNGVIGVTIASAAFALFSRKRTELMLFAFVLLILGFYFVTFEEGLGSVQHHSRFSTQYLASHNNQVKQCNNYYRGFFVTNLLTNGDFENEAVYSHDYCDRNWLAAELFFMILLQISLMFLVVVGAASVFEPQTVSVKNVESTEPTEMETRA